MKGNTISSLLVAIALFGSTEGQLRAAPGDDCWKVNSMCETEGALSSEVLTSQLPTAAVDCHTKCVADGSCLFFTVIQARGIATCYLLADCDQESFVENCL